MKIKEKARGRYRELLGDEYEEFEKYLLKGIRKSVRVNTLKIKVKSLIDRIRKRKGWEIEQAPFYDRGIVIDTEVTLGHTLEHYLGYIYSQGITSMIPPLVLNPSGEDIVLDMCASPGSKTTQMAQMMGNEGAIIANDVNGNRMVALSANNRRCGVRNTISTIGDGRKFKDNKLVFDKILVDAPCTGTGTIMRREHVAKEWSLQSSKKMSNLQKNLLEAAYHSLEEDGSMVYSTCSLEPEENEGVVNHILSKFDSKLVRINLESLNHKKGIVKWKGKKMSKEMEKCIRVYPHQNKFFNSGTEGFFVAKIKKGE